MNASTVLDYWSYYTFEEKINFSSLFLEDIKRKLRTSHGYSTQDDISKDLELSKCILVKLDEDVKRETIERHLTEFNHNRLGKRMVEILCDLRDVWEDYSEDITPKQMEQMKSKDLDKIDLDDLLPLLGHYEIQENKFVRLLRSMGHEVTKEPNQFMGMTRLVRSMGVEVTKEPNQCMDMTPERIQSMINEHASLQEVLTRSSEELVSTGRPLTSYVTHCMLRELSSEIGKICGILEEAIGATRGSSVGRCH